jgi:hypothetical protein
MFHMKASDFYRAVMCIFLSFISSSFWLIISVLFQLQLLVLNLWSHQQV